MSDNAESVGLLLLRAYAVTDHKRLVLAVLGILGVCVIVPDVVCAHVHFFDWNVCQIPVTGHFTFGLLSHHQCTTPHFHNVSLIYANMNYSAQRSVRGKHVRENDIHHDIVDCLL